ncbi:tannase and feruloyl esterase [Colletotrichum scovillei]|uniref:Carboxylic ester hydrolase n=1 Tax=Colletotrichum scovillei TaxID=1209932 RepID=A0A9P7QRH8_9PEZI|nr:tannase and feruloyl esterase [Colletotrichum scovillei]KAG7041660.1 tannase and feruloyl esterase [Colletotrichum scovillei]KAG7061689.1 tannase and feruloyl esterase [Colletotrichum scovillei]
MFSTPPRSPGLLGTTLLTLAALTPSTSASTSAKCDPSTFTFPSLPGLQHIKTTAVQVQNYTSFPNRFSEASLATTSASTTGIPPFCNVTVSYTHPGHDDIVNVHIWLPLEKNAWNERFMGLGGGGFVVGEVDGDGPSAAIQEGYVAAVTDGGHLASLPPDVWALRSPGNIDWPLLVNFGYRSLHELAVVGKAVLRAYYDAEESVCEDETDRTRCVGVPFSVTDEWIRLFIEKDPAFDPASMSRETFRDVFRRGVEEFDSVIGTPIPDMRRFRERGGKVLMWHGMADQAISIKIGRGLYEKAKGIEANRGVEIEKFWRYFEVPGVNHCVSMYGAPFPWSALEKLRAWVEDGVAPEQLDARGFKIGKDGKVVVDEEVRRICLYPEEGVWDGKKWVCVKPGEKIEVMEEKEEL